jgi:hypothetical protein
MTKRTRRTRSAGFKAKVAPAAVNGERTRQPTMRRANTSITNAAYSRLRRVVVDGRLFPRHHHGLNRAGSAGAPVVPPDIKTTRDAFNKAGGAHRGLCGASPRSPAGAVDRARSLQLGAKAASTLACSAASPGSASGAPRAVPLIGTCSECHASRDEVTRCRNGAWHAARFKRAGVTINPDSRAAA